MSVAFCSSNSASHSPTATPRRRRKQQLTKGLNLMRRSISLQYFDSDLAEKPVLPPKLSIGSRGSLNDSEKVGNMKNNTHLISRPTIDMATISFETK
jgi:hypothetical protein